MSYSNFQLNQRINNLQNQINNIGGVITLQDVCNNGYTTTTNIELITDPATPNQVSMNYSGIQVATGGAQNTNHQSDGILIVEPATGTIGQLLMDNLQFTKGGYLTEITNTGSALNINGQVSFNNPPHSVEPLNGNDLCTKGYVDSLVGQYSGGYNLFFNYSVTDGIYKSLGQSIVASAQQIVPITTDTTNQLVASFVSPALGITSIPSGIWNVLIYSEVSAVGGVLTYYFEVLKLTGVTETLIFTSGLSTDVNATTTPTAYPINGTLSAPYTILLTDKIIIKIYLHKDGTPLLVNTYFQNAYYSFTQTTLNAGTTILSSNNTFTGINKYTLGIKTIGVDTDTAVALDIGTITASSINIGSAASTLTTNGINNFNGTNNFGTTNITTFQNGLKISTNKNLDVASPSSTIGLFPSMTNGTLNFLQNILYAGTTNIQTLSTNANIVNIGSATTKTNILGLKASTINSITSSILDIGADAFTLGVYFNNKALGGITYGVNQFITLSTNTAAPSATQIGYSTNYHNGGTSTLSATPNTVTNIHTAASVPAGVWLFECSFNVNTQNVIQSQFSISTTSSAHNLNRIMNIQTTLSSAYAQIIGVVSLIATGNVYITGSSTLANVAINTINATRTRIA